MGGMDNIPPISLSGDEAASLSEMASLKVRRLRPGAHLPRKATTEASGFDLYACLGEGNHADLGPDVKLVPTGVALEVPPGFDAQVRPRSGLARQGVGVILGTIDADYRGEIFVSMHTFGTRASFRIEDGDRIAQLVISSLADLAVEEVEALSPSDRGDRGHGSTG